MAGVNCEKPATVTYISRLTATLVFVLCVAACDEGDPTLEEHLSELGIARDSLVTVDEETLVTVFVHDAITELLVFRPHSFGGWELTRDVADCPAPLASGTQPSATA